VKKIRDIRYYTANTEINQTYDIPKKIHYIGQRFALKLREFNFNLENYDHIYIFLNPSLSQDKDTISDRFRENWIKCIDYGYSIDKLNSLNDEEKSSEFCKITRNVLIKHCCKNNSQKAQINSIYNEILNLGEKINIIYKTLSNKENYIYIIIRILDSGQIALYYQINDSNVCFIKNFNNMFEINQMLGNIKIRENKIYIAPKHNSYSEYYHFEDIQINL